jgi:hypothetical protein
MSAASLIQPPGTAGMSWGIGEWESGASSSIPTLRIIGQEAATQACTAHESIPWDDREFEQAPRSVLRRVLLDVLRDPGRRGHWTEKLFPMVLRGTPARGRLVYETLREFADPRDIIVDSLVLYLRYGDAEPLVVGSGLLEDLGARSWPVLAAYARTVRPECAYFVPAIARLKDVDAEDRLQVLGILARSEDPELRWRVYEALDEFSLDAAMPIMKSLAESGDAGDAARAAAQERVQPDGEE